MAKNVIINGIEYASVPHVNIPLANGNGSAKFVDTDSGDAVADDIREGKKAWVDGNEVTGRNPVRSSADVTASGKKVTVPAGIYDASVEKNVADGTVTPTAAVSGSVIGDTETEYPVTVTPSVGVKAGYIAEGKTGAAVKKYVQTEEKTVTPSTSRQDVIPTNGKLLKKVSVDAVDVSATATEADVVSGKTFFANDLTRKTGTATVPTVGQDSITKALTIS